MANLVNYLYRNGLLLLTESVEELFKMLDWHWASKLSAAAGKKLDFSEFTEWNQIVTEALMKLNHVFFNFIGFERCASLTLKLLQFFFLLDLFRGLSLASDTLR